MQLGDPGVEEKVPAGQSVQLALPGVLVEPGGHAVQVALLVAPNTLEKVPAVQFKQDM